MPNVLTITTINYTNIFNKWVIFISQKKMFVFLSVRVRTEKMLCGCYIFIVLIMTTFIVALTHKNFKQHFLLLKLNRGDKVRNFFTTDILKS